MACLYPKPAYLSHDGKVQFVRHGKALGKRGFIHIRCGMCNGCKADHARDWSIRCYHESQLHHTSCFVTLTYNPEHLPPSQSLDKRDLQLFWKKLRFYLPKLNLRYFACGEYGSKKGRPHYHAVIFGYQPSKKYPVSISEKGHTQYTDPILAKAWGRGHVTFSDFDPANARYVAHYTADKLKSYASQTIDPETGLKPYERLDEKTGDIWKLCPEFQTSSLKPAIGLRWIQRHFAEVFPADSVVMDGKEYPPPRFYYEYIREAHPDLFEVVKAARREKSLLLPYEKGWRLHHQAQARMAKINQYNRPTHEVKI